MKNTTDPAQITGIGTVGVPVTDQQRSLDFFVNKLGFEQLTDYPMPGMEARWITLAPPNASVSVALIAHVTLPTGIETGIRFMTPDAETAHGVLRSHGVEVDEILRWPGVPAMFNFRDPDGNGYELVEAR